uniref:Uncharacterized protein n=1 Tax=Cacopsylla melanoneura TaxID=428564 RepID=A0A8D9BGT4_9HEMI
MNQFYTGCYQMTQFYMLSNDPIIQGVNQITNYTGRVLQLTGCYQITQLLPNEPIILQGCCQMTQIQLTQITQLYTDDIANQPIIRHQIYSSPSYTGVTKSPHQPQITQ